MMYKPRMFILRSVEFSMVFQRAVSECRYLRVSVEAGRLSLELMILRTALYDCPGVMQMDMVNRKCTFTMHFEKSSAALV